MKHAEEQWFAEGGHVVARSGPFPAPLRRPDSIAQCFGADADEHATLFAAAPDLYEALKLLANLGDASIAADIRAALRPHERLTFVESITKARAALAKAEGRQP